MKTIKVKDLIQSSFSNEQAEILNKDITKALEENQDKIILDFDGITRYTTLFFNFSTGYFLKSLGKSKYDQIFQIKNLTQLGESTYRHSYNNSIDDKYKDKEIQKEILCILEGTNEE